MNAAEITPEFFAIDQLRLDKDCLEQPSKYFEVAEELANAKRRLDKAQTDLKLVEAELSTDIRKSPEDYKIDKVTEGTVAAAIPLQKDYQDQIKEVRDARHDVDILTAAVTAMEHRKRSLTLLVNLHGMSYFADPVKGTKGEGREALENAGKRAVRTVGKLKREVAREDEEDEL